MTDEFDNHIEDIGRLTFNPVEQPSKIMPSDWYRLLRMVAINNYHIMQLFRQTHGLKDYKFDEVLKEIAEDFGVSYESLQNVKFKRFENEND